MTQDAIMMPDSSAGSRRRPFAGLCIAGGAVLLLAAWFLPATWNSLDPVLLEEAGRGTPGLVEFGENLLMGERPGLAALVLRAAQSLNISGADRLAAALEDEYAMRPESRTWGGWDPFLDPLITQADAAVAADEADVVGALPHFMPGSARRAVAGFLENTRSPGVRSLLDTRALTGYSRFVPVALPGGQPLESVILLTALLYQGDHFSPPLGREVKRQADVAVAGSPVDPLETFYLDILSLSRRLNWMQLSGLLRASSDTVTVGQFAHLAKVSPDDLPVMISGALLAASPDRVADYLIQHGRIGLADLSMALGKGQGAVRLLIDRGLPVAAAGPRVDFAARLALFNPGIALTIKYAGFLSGAFLILFGLDRFFFAGGPAPGIPHMKSGLLAVILAGFLVILSEPLLLKAQPPSEFAIRLAVPVLTFQPEEPTLVDRPPVTTMDQSTIISILFFASVQVCIYLICLMKIRDIDRRDVRPLLKLRIMENEENLFDSGLYVGIAGTAAALVMQVLGVIEPNLLAAYSSNLFGITTVALVKIRHVRPYRTGLILQAEERGELVAAGLEK